MAHDPEGPPTFHPTVDCNIRIGGVEIGFHNFYTLDLVKDGLTKALKLEPDAPGDEATVSDNTDSIEIIKAAA